MFARGLLLCGLLVLLAPSWALAWSYARCDAAYHNARGLLKHGDTLPVWPSPCRDEVCRARQDLICVIDPMVRRDRPATMSYPTRREADVAANGFQARIAAFGREHPKRVPLYCDLLVQDARSTTGRLNSFGMLVDGSVIEDITELAVRLDRPGRLCSARVMAAFPRFPGLEAIVEESREYCWASPKLCNRIRLPPAP